MQFQDSKNLEIYCDGGARGNPGPAASAFIAKSNKGEVIYQEKKFIGRATNNVAEYSGVLMALTWLSNQNLSAVIFLDSELVGRQLRGEYKIKNKNLLDYVLKIKDLEKRMAGKIVYKNIPRSLNHEADLLVNKALDAEKF